MGSPCRAEPGARRAGFPDALDPLWGARDRRDTSLALLLLADAKDWRFLAGLAPAGFARWLRDVASPVKPGKYPINQKTSAKGYQGDT